MNKPPIRKVQGYNDQLKFLIYGPTGVGKTHLLGTMANNKEFFGRVLMLAIDPGDLTLSANTAVDQENIDVARVRTVEELEKWALWLETENVKSKEYGSLIVEGATDIGEMALLEVLARVHKENSTRPKYSPDIGHYKEQQIIALKCVRIFRDLPMHVAYSALSVGKQDKDSPLEYIRPAVPGMLINNLGAYFDFIGYLSVGKFKDKEGSPRLLRMQPTELIQAKDRTRRLGEVLVNPSFPEILDLILNGEEKYPAPRADHQIRRPKFKATN